MEAACRNGDYRQYYRDYYNIEFGQDMLIHHIDFDHWNNSIDNLLLLPKRLHGQYHGAVKHLCVKGIFDGNVRLENHIDIACKGQYLATLGPILLEAQPWILFKNRLGLYYPGVVHQGKKYRLVETIDEVMTYIPKGYGACVVDGKLIIGDLATNIVKDEAQRG